MIHALLAIELNVRSVSYTAPDRLADTTTVAGALVNPCGSGAIPEANPITVNLYWALAYQANWSPVYLRTHTVQPGARDTFLLDDSRPATYWVEPVNAAGPGCRSGITLGVPTTDVPPSRKMLLRPGYFDVQGRRIDPTRSGRYFGRDSVVIR